MEKWSGLFSHKPDERLFPIQAPANGWGSPILAGEGFQSRGLVLHEVTFDYSNLVTNARIRSMAGWVGKMKRHQWLLFTAATALLAPAAYAGIYLLDFSGAYQTNSGDIGVYNGFILIDYSMPDFYSDPNVGFYDAVVDARLYVDTVTWIFDPIPGQFSFVAVSNDDSISDDSFQITLGLTNEQSSIDTAMTLRFVDLDLLVLSSDSLPTQSEFSNFELDNIVDTVTTIKIPVGEIPGNQLVTGTVLTANLRPVPLPPTIVYLLSALLGVGYLNRKHN